AQSEPKPVLTVRPELASARITSEGALQRLSFAPASLEAGIASSRPAAAPQAQVTPGAPPSTLQQQALKLAPEVALTAPPALARPVAAPASESRSSTQSAAGPGLAAGFEIQVGAYATAAEADRALTTVRGNAADLLRASEGRALLAVKDARQIYRARFI